MNRKLFQIAVCLSIVGLALSDEHNVYQCPDPSTVADTPLCRLDISEKAILFGTITKVVNCPESGVNKMKIACIIVKDQVENNNGGYATVSSGGLNNYFVQINLKSQWSKGINFHVEVYTVANSTALDYENYADVTDLTQ